MKIRTIYTLGKCVILFILSLISVVKVDAQKVLRGELDTENVNCELFHQYDFYQQLDKSLKRSGYQLIGFDGDLGDFLERMGYGGARREPVELTVEFEAIVDGSLQNNSGSCKIGVTLNLIDAGKLQKMSDGTNKRVWPIISKVTDQIDWNNDDNWRSALDYLTDCLKGNDLKFSGNIMNASSVNGIQNLIVTLGGTTNLLDSISSSGSFELTVPYETILRNDLGWSDTVNLKFSMKGHEELSIKKKISELIKNTAQNSLNVKFNKSSTDIELKGYVRNKKNNKPIQDASVKYKLEGKLQDSTITDSNGSFEIISSQKNELTSKSLYITHPRFKPYSISSIEKNPININMMRNKLPFAYHIPGIAQFENKKVVPGILYSALALGSATLLGISIHEARDNDQEADRRNQLGQISEARVFSDRADRWKTAAVTSFAGLGVTFWLNIRAAKKLRRRKMHN